MSADNQEEQLERLKLAGELESMTVEQLKYYLSTAADMGEVTKGNVISAGFKRCGNCGHGKKYYLFNKNSGSKTNTSGNCKECQKNTASKSYSKTKQRRNYKKYYQENKEMKQQHARSYYQSNKDTIKVKHKEYLQTKDGKKVMERAHTKRRRALAENRGIPYTRAMIIERDGAFSGNIHPMCYICDRPIEDTSGEGLHLDHVIPVVEKGLDCFTNVASSHKACNLTREKDARRLTAAQVQLIIERAEAYIDAHPEQFEG